MKCDKNNKSTHDTSVIKRDKNKRKKNIFAIFQMQKSLQINKAMKGERGIKRKRQLACIESFLEFESFMHSFLETVHI